MPDETIQQWRTATEAIDAYRHTLEQHGVGSDADRQFWRDPQLAPLLDHELARRLLGVRNFIEEYGREYERFRTSTLRTFDGYGGVEDGWTHPAEEGIRQALEADTERVRGWLRRLMDEQLDRSPWRAGQLIRCIGRCDLGLVGDLGPEFVRQGIRHRHSDVRDAAVIAVEKWREEDPSLLAELRPDEEPEDYLARYMRKLLRQAEPAQGSARAE